MGAASSDELRWRRRPPVSSGVGFNPDARLSVVPSRAGVHSPAGNGVLSRRHQSARRGKDALVQLEEGVDAVGDRWNQDLSGTGGGKLLVPGGQGKKAPFSKGC